MSSELQQLIDALRELPSDVERKQFFINIRSSFTSLLADIWEVDRQECETIIER